MRYIKGNLGKTNALGKMMKLIDDINFINLQQVDKIIDWSISPVVKL